MKAISLLILAALLMFTGCTKVRVLKGNDRLNTPEIYKPPVEITVVAKTDCTNLRLA